MRKLVKQLLVASALAALSTPAYAAKPCADADRDGYTDAACGGTDCNDANPNVNPGKAEVCGDAIDNNCNGQIDEGCQHRVLAWTGYGMCRTCHPQQANDVFAAGHYQWQGSAPYNTNSPGVKQGKIQNSVNSYCVNILGNWDGIDASKNGACSACHIGRGLKPTTTATTEQLDNIDCLLCHQQAYKRKRNATTGLFEPDTAAMTITMDQAVQTIHRPVRANCLQCHAKGGGGDAVKRGDMSLAQTATTDRNHDVHMATTGANFNCQSCHKVLNHHIAGSGTDLRVVDYDVPVTCVSCHTTKESSAGHATAKINDHVKRVACQTCHIPRYGRNASDTAATEATEIHRDWTHTHNTTPPLHPARTMANDLLPRYAFWNGYNMTALLYDTATLDAATNAYPTSRPIGGINDTYSKLFPFKYKTASQPYAPNRKQLVAIDTRVFFSTGDYVAATQQGLLNMGYPSTEPFTMVTTDTYQLITHTIPPATGNVLACTTCHENTSQMNLPALGYAKKADLSVICTQCHALRTYKGLSSNHDRHVTSRKYDCSWCHTFSRPERGLTLPK